MKGIVVENQKTKPTLVWSDVDDVEIGPDEVLVDVHASAVNRADLMQARGAYPPPPGASPILGLEMAGVVVDVGDNVADWQEGDRVCALLPGGGYAQQVSVPADMLISLPDDWSFAQGAALPEVWLTAYVNLFLEGKLQSGETLLVHAAGSGVGTAAIQLGKAVGATVYATAGAAFKLERCKALGADLTINYKEQDFAQEIMAVSDGVDVILDPVAAAYLERNVEVLKRFGRLILIGLLSGISAPLNMAHMLRKRLTIVGSTLRTRPLDEKVSITRQFAEQFMPQLKSGELQTIIDTTFPIEQAQAAHEYVAANKNLGKVILIVE